jgi:hypothetical protein
MNLTTYRHLVSRLRMRGAIRLLPLYAFVVWTWEGFYFYHGKYALLFYNGLFLWSGLVYTILS